MFSKLFVVMISIFLLFGIAILIWSLINLGWQGLFIGIIYVITIGAYLESL